MTGIENRSLRKPSLLLPIVGIILILTIVTDFVIRLFTQQWDQPDAQVNLLNELIDRGIIPLIGLALVYVGIWINDLLSPPLDPALPSSPWSNGQFWIFVFASLMGLVFLLIIPLHFSSAGSILDSTSTRLEQQEAQAKFAIQQEQQQVQSILDSGQLDQILRSGNLPPEQIATLQAIQKDPQSLDTKVAERLAEVTQQKESALEKLKGEVGVTRLRAGLRSFLLALGFIAIGWTGLRDAS